MSAGTRPFGSGDEIIPAHERGTMDILVAFRSAIYGIGAKFPRRWLESCRVRLPPVWDSIRLVSRTLGGIAARRYARLDDPGRQGVRRAWIRSRFQGGYLATH